MMIFFTIRLLQINDVLKYQYKDKLLSSIVKEYVLNIQIYNATI